MSLAFVEKQAWGTFCESCAVKTWLVKSFQKLLQSSEGWLRRGWITGGFFTGGCCNWLASLVFGFGVRGWSKMFSWYALLLAADLGCFLSESRSLGQRGEIHGGVMVGSSFGVGWWGEKLFAVGHPVAWRRVVIYIGFGRRVWVKLTSRGLGWLWGEGWAAAIRTIFHHVLGWVTAIAPAGLTCIF